VQNQLPTLRPVQWPDYGNRDVGRGLQVLELMTKSLWWSWETTVQATTSKGETLCVALGYGKRGA
jgi:hypothetical protein